LAHALQAVVFDSGQSSGFNEQTANTSPSTGLLTVQAQLFTVQSWLLARPSQTTEICPVHGFEVINDRPGSVTRVALKCAWHGLTVATVTSKATSGESGETSE
jgi:hypothetical protein